MFPAPPSYMLPDYGPPPGPANPPEASSSLGMIEDKPSATEDVNVPIYLDLWQEILANTPEPPEDDEPVVYSGVVTKDDSRSTLCSHLISLGMPEIRGDSKTLFSFLQAAIDGQAWPFIPYIRETHLVESERFPHQPDILVGSQIRSYFLNQRTGTLKLLTMRGIVTISTLSESGIGNIGIDPNLRHALNYVGSSGHGQKIILQASFARRKGNGMNAPQFLVFGLRFGDMTGMGYTFCKDPQEPSSGPIGHVTLRCSSTMTEDALIRRGASDKSKGSGFVEGSATSNPVQGPATVKPACCPYCLTGYSSMDSLRKHLQRMLDNPCTSCDKHPVDEISNFIRNTSKKML